MALSQDDLQAIRQVTQEVTAEVAGGKQEELAVMCHRRRYNGSGGLLVTASGEVY